MIVTLSNDANERVIADAVRIQWVGDLPGSSNAALVAEVNAEQLDLSFVAAALHEISSASDEFDSVGGQGNGHVPSQHAAQQRRRTLRYHRSDG